MKHLLLFLLFVPFCTVAHSSERSVLIHPGETVYARFLQKGTKLKLLSVSKEKDEQAQVIVTVDPVNPAKMAPIKMKIENKFAWELHYRAEVRFRKNIMPVPSTTSRVVAGKIAFTDLPPILDEVGFLTFELEK